tara:strand:- start:251 stop:430 length:180 start_codon:yes stop_codon:yes gene_type:complete
MSTHKSGYEIRSEVLKVAAEICKEKFKNDPTSLNEEKIIQTANKLYAFVENKGGRNGIK